MKDDTRRVLEAFEKELWEEDLLQQPKEKTEEEKLDELLRQILSETDSLTEPAFEDPDKLQYSDEPVVYRNFSNDYGKNETEEIENTDEQEPEVPKHGKLWVLAWLCVAGAVCLGILGAILYRMGAV